MSHPEEVQTGSRDAMVVHFPFRERFVGAVFSLQGLTRRKFVSMSFQCNVDVGGWKMTIEAIRPEWTLG